MIHRPRCLGFVAEAAQHLVVIHAVDVEAHGLERYGSSNVGVHCPVDESHGATAQFTDAYTLVNGAFGVKWMQGKVTTLVKVNNLLNKDIQQHVFGDILKRSAVFEVRIVPPRVQ